MTTRAPCVAHANAMPRPTPPPAPVTSTVRPSSSARRGHRPIQVPPSATRVPAVRKCASGSSSSAINGARSVDGSPACPNAGVDNEMARVSASAVPRLDPVVWGGGDRVHGDAVGAPLAATTLGQHPHAFRDRGQHRELGARRPCRRSGPRTRGCRRWLAAARPRRGPTTTPRQAPLAAGRPRVLVEVHEPVRRHRARRQPGVHDLVDAAQAAVRGRQRVDHLRFGAEAALEREGGDAELVEAVEQPVGERAGPGDDRARPVMGRTSGEGGLRPPRRWDGVSGCERR